MLSATTPIPIRMENIVPTGDSFHISNLKSMGNTSIGGSNVTQNATFTITTQQTAVDLAAILHAALGMNDFPQSEVVEADQL